MKRTTLLMLLVAAMVLGACHTSQKLERQDGTTFRAKQKEPTNVFYVTKYTYTDKHGKTYPVELDHKGRAYYMPKTWYGECEFKLPEIGKKINPDAYDKTKKKGEWKKNLPNLLK